ncbi:uncharacterized protein IUM83_04909 [Phytophthora cinnamomi]|uniref:uncharacterized protein n=1 Tax=Phytophthora cinnamomi TaxID=4785 RepID=UPI00355A688B|nr:hypothetical protein IUM83_04909 [Phytophthora cinnamomi]
MENSASETVTSLRDNSSEQSQERVREKLNLLGDLQRQVKVLEAQYEQLLLTSHRMSNSTEAERENANTGGAHRPDKIGSLKDRRPSAAGDDNERKKPGLKIYPILEHAPEVEG